MMEQREARANAQILEMIGDIPDADAKPPENVLFICKLNPATTGEDLEIIFSRFGPIISSEVIKDQKTGDSLQYAFIEFENEDDCLNAYFKMENVLIDDRRIHVDFCQSLAKVKGIRQRQVSLKEDKAPENDGLISKQKPKDDSYEMVFDGDGGDSPKGKKRKRRWDVASERLPERREESESERRGEKHKKRERVREESERSKDDGEGGERDRKRGREERGREERRERGREERKHRDRPRSRSREREGHHSHRKRTRSRERR